MRTETICPVCWHREEMGARLNGHEPCHDDPYLMRFFRPAGPRGQQITQWDNGYWICRECGAQETPERAGIMLDAVLMLSDPHCDSIQKNGLHADTMTAMRLEEVDRCTKL